MCPSCGAENPPGAKFCMECGTALAAAAPAAAAGAAAPPEAPPEERRQATVLFADLSGYTAVAERMDPEAVKALVDRTLRRLGEEIERFGGTIDKYIGDNVMGVFGAPVAHEDDPERAVRAGLGMQEAMERGERQSREQYGVELRAAGRDQHRRGARRRRRRRLHGHRRHRQRRGAAAGRGRPGQRHGRRATYRATGEAIDYERLEPLDAEGQGGAGPGLGGDRRPRRAAARGAGRAQTPLVGREDEPDLLVSLVERVVREERPHLVTVIGQAGVGKSRLLRELMSTLAGVRRSPDDPARPVPALRRRDRLLGARRGPARRVRDPSTPTRPTPPGRSCARGVTRADERARATSPAGRAQRRADRDLLGIEPPEELDRSPSERPAADARGALLGRALGGRGDGPAPAAGARVRGHPLGRRGHARPDRAPGALGPRAAPDRLPGARRAARAPARLGRRSPQRDLDLPRAAHRERDARAGRGAAAEHRRTAPRDVVPQVAERAGGNPLFAEEMVRRLLEEETVEAAGAARHRAGAARRAPRLARASSGGCSSRPPWSGRPSGRARWRRPPRRRASTWHDPRRAPRRRTCSSPSAGSRLAGEREYAFKHVLIRDVAYGMLPKAVRCRKHFEVGGVHRRARRRPHRRGRRRCSPSTTAAPRRSAAEAGLERRRARRAPGPGARVLEAAGDAAAALYSNAEAFDHYTAALEISESLDPGAVARIGEKQGDVALRMGRVDAAVGVWERCLEYHRAAGGPRARRRPAPQDRRGALAQGRAKRLDRALPAGHQPAQGRAAVPRARAPLRGGRLALHAHGRQHARHLRLREGAAPGRAARRDARGQPRPRDLRPRVRPDRRLREGAREPRALGRAGARVRPRRDDPRAAHARLPPRGLRGRLRAAPPRPTARRSRSRRRSATCPRRSSCTPRSASSPSTAPTGTRSSAQPRRAPGWPSARAWSASSASPT